MTSKDFSFTGYQREHCEVARKLRKPMTSQEKRLWYGFLKNNAIKFYRQRPIDRFIVDFYCPKAHLVIELDGSQHYTENGIEYDAERTAILEQYGLMIMRFSNMEVDRNFSGVCEMIRGVVRERVAE